MTVMLRQIDPPPAKEEAPRVCGNCGYDLRAFVEARCPECGIAFDPSGTPVANIPWFHRHIIGTGAALWRTMWISSFQTRRLYEEVALDTSLNPRSSRAFRLTCVGVASVSTALSAALLMPRYVPEIFAFTIALFPLLLFFQLTTMLLDASPLNYWPARAARFVALHDFTAAPLLFLPLATLALEFCRLSGRPPALGALLIIAILVQWLTCTFRYQKGATGRGLQWLLMRVLMTGILWGTFAWFCFLLVVFMTALTYRLFEW